MVNLHPQQIANAAAAGVQFLNLDSTLVPGNLRQQINSLEVILQNVAAGKFRVVNADDVALQSGRDGTAEPGPGEKTPAPEEARQKVNSRKQ